jgi:hypothetical protein
MTPSFNRSRARRGRRLPQREVRPALFFWSQFVPLLMLVANCAHSSPPAAHSKRPATISSAPDAKWQVVNCLVRLPTCTGEVTSEYLVCGEPGRPMDEICQSLFTEEKWPACHADRIVRVGECPSGVDKVRHTLEGGKSVYRREPPSIFRKLQ